MVEKCCLFHFFHNSSEMISPLPQFSSCFEGMIASDEPGYYLENEFGIRLETDIESVVVQTKVKKNIKIP